MSFFEFIIIFEIKLNFIKLLVLSQPLNYNFIDFMNDPRDRHYRGQLLLLVVPV